MCCVESDELQFLNIVFPNNFTALISVTCYSMFNCVTETSSVTEGRKFISTAL